MRISGFHAGASKALIRDVYDGSRYFQNQGRGAAMFIAKWKPEEICEHILARHGNEPLNYHYYARTYPAVHAAGCRIFGSWENTIEACGIDYAEIRRYTRWTKGKVVEAIAQRHAQGKTLSSNEIQKEAKALYMAAMKRFRNWGEAVKSAGIDYDAVRKRHAWSKNKVIKAVRQLHKQDEDLAYPNMRRNHQYIMAAAAKTLGSGSWAEARREAGIDTNYRKLAAEKALETKRKQRCEQEST